MVKYSEKFLDVVLVDSTYKRNRFNLPLVNIIGINNYGRNILLGFGLLSKEDIESYSWIFENLKYVWKKDPNNFVIDECESIKQGILFLICSYWLGIQRNFKSRILFCGWHIQKNFISHFSGLAKKDKVLYERLKNLPFISKEEKFNQVIKDTRDSTSLNNHQKDYLKKKF